MDLSKRRKPPACDRCKAKRVICHPNPDGCPRCSEKGVECTTTPTARRKAPRKSRETTEAPVGLAETSASFAAVNQPTFAPIASTSGSAHVPSTSTTSSALVSATPSNPLSPALVKHLFFCLQQHPTFDQPLIRAMTVHDSLGALSWRIDLLPTQQRAYAYAVCANAATIAFSRHVVGDDLALSNWLDLQSKGTDLRAYGRRRANICRTLACEARRVARNADVAVEPTKENAATCALLNALDSSGDVPPKSRPWLAACFSHIRALPEIWPKSSDRFETMLWMGFFICDCCSDLVNNPSITRADELLFAGADPPDLAEFDKALQDTLAQPIARDLWPDLKPLGLLLLRVSRELVEDLLGPHAVRGPLKESAVLRALEDLGHLRSVAHFYAQIVDRTGEPLPSVHFDRALTSAARYTRGAALRATRSFGTTIWAGLVLPLFIELRRRSRLNHENCCASFASSDADTRAAAERLEVYVARARAMAFAGLDVVVADLQRSQALITWTHVRKGLLPEYATLLLEELTAGRIPLNEHFATAAEALSAGLKLVGYVHATVTNDALIAQLDGQVACHHLATRPMQLVDLGQTADFSYITSSASTGPLRSQPPFRSLPDARPLDPAIVPTSFATIATATLPAHPSLMGGVILGGRTDALGGLDGVGAFPEWAW